MWSCASRYINEIDIIEKSLKIILEELTHSYVEQLGRCLEGMKQLPGYEWILQQCWKVN